MSEEQAYRLLEKKSMSQKHRDKDFTEERKTLDEVFDHSTLKAVYKLMKEGIIDTVEHPILTGKEAKVFLALGEKGELLVLKIFRTSNAEFKSMATYITGDPRFRSIKSGRRGIVFTWTQKEFRNLIQAHDAGVRVPKPIAFEKNVLVMEFIGEDGDAAPLIKDMELEDPEAMSRMVMEQYKLMYTKAQLVHADMSEYNILLHDGIPYIIDVGQAVDLRHPMAREFLRRDLKTLARFFKKHGIEFDVEVEAKAMEDTVKRKEEEE